jgi:hypothetical protein
MGVKVLSLQQDAPGHRASASVGKLHFRSKPSAIQPWHNGLTRSLDVMLFLSCHTPDQALAERLKAAIERKNFAPRIICAHASAGGQIMAGPAGIAKSVGESANTATPSDPAFTLESARPSRTSSHRRTSHRFSIVIAG